MSKTGTTPEPEETYEQHVGGYIVEHLQRFITKEKIDKHGWTVKELEDGTVVCKPSQEADNHSTNPFNGMSKEVLDFMFDTPDMFCKENPELRLPRNARRLNPIITKIVIVELARAVKLEREPSIKQILQEAIESIREPDPSEDPFRNYTQDEWNKLLDVAEKYFFKALSDLDDHDFGWMDLLYAGTGWIQPDTKKLNEVMTTLGLNKKDGKQNLIEGISKEVLGLIFDVLKNTRESLKIPFNERFK